MLVEKDKKQNIRNVKQTALLNNTSFRDTILFLLNTVQNTYISSGHLNFLMTQLLFLLLALLNPAKGEPFSKPQNFGVDFHTIKNVQLTTESQFNKALASYLNGETEVSIAYDFTDSDGKIISGHIRVDIENDEYVIEGGLDKRSSLDGIQQAVFASVLTGKKAAVAVYDTDGFWAKFEYRIWAAARKLGIKFIWFDGHQIKHK